MITQGNREALFHYSAEKIKNLCSSSLWTCLHHGHIKGMVDCQNS